MPYRDDFSRLCGPLSLRDHNNDWNQKMFILDEEQCLLRYFNTYVYCPRGEKLWKLPEGEINLRFITKIEEKNMSPEDANSFEVQMFDTKKHYLKADDEKEMQEWIKNLRRVTVDPSRRQEGKVSQAIKNSLPRNLSQTSPPQDDDVTNGKDKPSEHISYETKIIGGVVVRKPVVMKSDSDSEGDIQDRTLSGSQPPGHGIRLIKDGYLTKKGAVVKNWKRRYFKLDLVKLSYYEKSTDRDPIRSIPTIDISSVRITKIFEGKPRENLFEVKTANRTFYMQADCQEEMDSWVEALSEAIRSVRGRSASGPL